MPKRKSRKAIEIPGDMAEYIKLKIHDFDVYMARLREALETRPEKRTPEQKRFINFDRNGPSYNKLFKKSKT